MFHFLFNQIIKKIRQRISNPPPYKITNTFLKKRKKKKKKKTKVLLHPSIDGINYWSSNCPAWTLARKLPFAIVAYPLLVYRKYSKVIFHPPLLVYLGD